MFVTLAAVTRATRNNRFSYRQQPSAAPREYKILYSMAIMYYVLNRRSYTTAARVREYAVSWLMPTRRTHYTHSLCVRAGRANSPRQHNGVYVLFTFSWIDIQTALIISSPPRCYNIYEVPPRYAMSRTWDRVHGADRDLYDSVGCETFTAAGERRL